LLDCGKALLFQGLELFALRYICRFMAFQAFLIIAIVFVAFAIIQLFYTLWFFIRLCFYKRKADVITENLPPVSLIVCARNEENNLRQFLHTWATQDYKTADGSFNYELILVDDNSEDGSAFFYNEIKEKYSQHLRIVQLKQEAKGIKGKKFPLSIGIKEAKHEIVLLTDADCMPATKNWIAQMMQGHMNASKSIVLGLGKYAKHDNFLNKWIRWETIHTAIQYFTYALAGKPYMGVGRNLSYNKQLFFSNKGFSSHSQLISGDDDLFINQVATAKNTAIEISPDAFTISEPKTTYSAWWFQKSRHMGTARLYKPEHRMLLGLYSFTHTMFWLTFIPALFCFKLLPVTIGIFLFRLIVHWIVMGINAFKLQEPDLIGFVPIFDMLTVYYNLKLFPQIFNSKDSWK
jgi:glycosyltransferase involved in cell wall biosynthesis